MSEGIKYDQGKARYDLLPYDALDLVAQVYTMGAQKYADRNWEKGMAWGRLFAATQRHLAAFWEGEELDPESGLPHLAHAAFGVLGLLHYSLTSTGTDDRAKRVAATSGQSSSSDDATAAAVYTASIDWLRKEIPDFIVWLESGVHPWEGMTRKEFFTDLGEVQAAYEAYREAKKPLTPSDKGVQK